MARCKKRLRGRIGDVVGPVQSPAGIVFQVKVRNTGETVAVELKVPGLHNVANALAALSVAKACGVTLKEAAAHLGLSPKTVDVHRAQIMRRLDIHSVQGLVLYALRTGLIDAGHPEQ